MVYSTELRGRSDCRGGGQEGMGRILDTRWRLCGCNQIVFPDPKRSLSRALWVGTNTLSYRSRLPMSNLLGDQTWLRRLRCSMYGPLGEDTERRLH